MTHMFIFIYNLCVNLGANGVVLNGFYLIYTIIYQQVASLSNFVLKS